MIDVVKEQLTDFGQLYSRYHAQEPIALQLLQTQNYFLKELSFDPINGDALPLRMSNWLTHNKMQNESGELHDHVTQLVDHCVDAIGNILLSPRQTVIRVHEMTPVYLAQRLDSRSVQWLSRKPGNNMREKLAANPNILASTRKMSLDTLENRLLKSLLKRLENLLLYRLEAGFQLTEKQEGLLISIKQALRLKEFVAIKPWQNMPPNNVLLQDKQYRKVWRAWQLLQRLELNCQRQQQEFVASGFVMFSTLLTQLSSMTSCVVLDQPWQFKLDYLSICTGHKFREKPAQVTVEAIESVVDDTSHGKIKPSAKLTLLLTETGHIKVTRYSKLGGTQTWNLDFQLVNGLTYVKLTSDSRNHQRNEKPILATPENYLYLTQSLLNQVILHDQKMRNVANTSLNGVSDFITLMLDGASCKALLGSNTSGRWLGPLFIDNRGLDCSQSRALDLSDDVFSAQELTLVSQDDKNRQISLFSSELARQLKPTIGMHYLVHDHHSDFETYELRREINRNFTNATPLPKSIASVFSTLTKQQFKRNDLIMVLDSDHEGIYATPIIYCWGENPGDEYLERHPSIKLSTQGERHLLQDALEQSGLPKNVAERFIELYSYREIVTNKANLVLKDANYWYRIPTGLKVSRVDIKDALIKEVGYKKFEKAYFVSVSPAIKHQKGIKATQWLKSDPLSGSQRLLKLQHQQPKKIFWKDHLPQLMTRLPVNGIEKDFFFVDSYTSIKPERDISVPIDIEQTFTLPSGKKDIRFSVYQGKGSNRQAFSLLLTLKQALKSDCVCDLTLTYTYGEEQPYKLRFTPIEGSNVPFHYVDAQWGKKENQEVVRTLAIPIFPERLSFEDLRAYSSRSGKKEDIVDWIESNFEQLDDIYQFMRFGKNKKRFNFAYRDIDWIPNKDFGFYKSHANYESIFVHKDQFKELDTSSEEYFSGDVLTKGDNRYSLVNVGLQGELSRYERKNLSKSWRFPMITFSEQSRCFDDQEIPVVFAQKGKQAIVQAEDTLKLLNGNDVVLERELKQFLCYCHKLMPQTISDELLQNSTDKSLLRREKTWFTYALGDVSQSWQKELLSNILNPVDDSGGTRAVSFEILSVAMWRVESAVHQLSFEQLCSLAERLNNWLLDEIKWLKIEDKSFKWNSFILRLELLLALLRTRESSDNKISTLFSLDSQMTETLLSTVEQITDKQGAALAQQINLPGVHSRVKLAIDKPEGYHRTPDLLYALKLYLSGEDGADQITITELINNE
ncbi:hypothetical protein VroAM7_15960 [Vibrio rotiferianus]|uniref:DUF2357 domain-containing protein n=1 Tax=Vibrio rotiferianus TaxID=190895 RepID=A0A510I5F8_9VIBR|nr:DUF2357 domain-containing protein [Vibrio rotiferianus]BBL88943.1 hypothetical protein VroAM7_15960 [Vibrio rotiferianus]